MQIPDESSARLYISVRTRVADGGLVLHPAKIRLLRRMVRDRLYRSRSVEETLRLYDSVQRGEGLYIMPHKHRATHEIDTFSPMRSARTGPCCSRTCWGWTRRRLRRSRTFCRSSQTPHPCARRLFPARP